SPVAGVQTDAPLEAHIGPLLTVVMTTVTMLVAWCLPDRACIKAASHATLDDARLAVQAPDWHALVVTLDYDGIGNGSLVVGGYIFSRDVDAESGRYVYLADPCGDPWQVQTLTDGRKPSEWMRALTGIDPWTSRAPAPAYLRL